MTIDHCFIPCAGFGSRMGPVGKDIPKPLWPIFEKPMLEIQLAFARSLGLSQFIANTHHQSESLRAYNEANSLEVRLLYEKDLLGNGGSFHNLKINFPEVKNIFVANPDVFLMLSKRDWKRFFKESKCGNSLILMPCYEIYNEVRLKEDGSFLEVTPPPLEKRNYLTYTGFSLINLNSFNYISGKSSFFKSVVSSKLGKTVTFIPEDPYEYWDFGTLDLYLSNIRLLLSKKSGLFWNFLTENKIIIDSLNNDRGYVSHSRLFKSDSTGVSIRSSLKSEFTLL